MKSRVGWKYVDGEEVFNIDFSNLEGDILLEHLLFCCVETEKIDRKAKFLINYQASKMGFSLLNYTLDAAKNIQPYVDKSAIIGMDGFKKKLFKVYAKFTGSKARLFDELEDAKDYLFR